MKENLDLNQILFDELVEFPRKRLGISIREFCAEAHVGTATSVSYTHLTLPTIA